MFGATFVLFINFGMAMLLVLAFALITRMGPAYASARWFALGYGAGALAMVTELLIPLGIAPLVLYVGGQAFYLVAMLGGLYAMMERRSLPLPTVPSLVFLIVAAAITAALYGLPRSDTLRQAVYQLPIAAVLLATAFVVFRQSPLRKAEKALVFVLLLMSAQIGTKPFLSSILGGIGETSMAYVGTLYAAYSQVVGGVVALSMGLLCVLLYIRDMLADARRKAETDDITGLSNWRGLRSQANAQFSSTGGVWMNSVLIIADIDNFSDLNVAHGAQGGDQMVLGFAELMRGLGREDALLVRMGSNEFAVFLPASELFTARLIAENLRSGFSACEFGKPDVPFHATVSLGIAARLEGESIELLISRTRVAVAASKHDGRNRITVSDAEEPFLLRRFGTDDR